MGCLLVLFSAFAPRLVVLFAWIARPNYFDAVFDSWIFPLLGLLFLPFTTLMYLLLGGPPEGVHGLDWLWIVLAVIMISETTETHGGSAARSSKAWGGTRERRAPPPAA